MSKKIIPELDKLYMEIGTYRKSEELKKLYEFIKKFPYIAPYNAMLIHIQKPGSQYVASASQWQRIFNRSINPSARPLIILRPFGPVSFVFELSDTYGNDPFPEELLNPFKVKGKISENVYERTISSMKNDGILYHEADMGTCSAGFIQTVHMAGEIKITKKDKEIWVKILYDMGVNRTHPIETKFATIIHELGHLYCGHLGTPDPKWWEDRRRLGRREREFEAESICWLICERMGIQNPSAEYLSGYIKDYEEIPKISIDTVLKAVGIIETMIKGSKGPRKEIITRTRKLQRS